LSSVNYIASYLHILGGNPKGCGGPKCGQVAGGFAYGPKAENVDFIHPLHVTKWKRGEANGNAVKLKMLLGLL